MRARLPTPRVHRSPQPRPGPRHPISCSPASCVRSPRASSRPSRHRSATSISPRRRSPTRWRRRCASGAAAASRRAPADGSHRPRGTMRWTGCAARSAIARSSHCSPRPRPQGWPKSTSGFLCCSDAATPRSLPTRSSRSRSARSSASRRRRSRGRPSPPRRPCSSGSCARSAASPRRASRCASPRGRSAPRASTSC